MNPATKTTSATQPPQNTGSCACSGTDSCICSPECDVCGCGNAP